MQKSSTTSHFSTSSIPVAPDHPQEESALKRLIQMFARIADTSILRGTSIVALDLVISLDNFRIAWRWRAIARSLPSLSIDRARLWRDLGRRLDV
jgi:hypothetical protein